jgi:ABC-type microcin C transport system permease subunit YejE
MWQDLTAKMSASISLGKLWYTHAPQSLQHAETIISRYIDPCGLVAALDCTPFLWHPAISTMLTWPAALVFIGFTALFGLLGPRQAGGAKRRGPRRG